MIRIREVPREYLLEKEEFIKEIGYKEDAEYTIKLKHKKGSIRIENIPGSIFGVYNLQDNIIGKYATNENGTIDIKDINIGNYVLKQEKAPDGYDKMDDIKFTVEENKKTQIGILNNKDNKPEEKPKDEVENNKPEEKPKDEVENNKPGEKPKDEVENNKPGEEPKDDVEDNKPEEKPKNDVKENELIGNLDKDQQDDNNVKEVEKEKKEILEIRQSMKKLPRTGNDYFELKVIILNSIVFMILMLILCLEIRRKKLKRPLK